MMRSGGRLSTEIVMLGSFLSRNKSVLLNLSLGHPLQANNNSLMDTQFFLND